MAKGKSDAALKRDIIKILRQHVGAKNAIDAGTIGRRIGVRENATHATTRALITQIMAEEDIPIAASVRGYFIIENEHEFREYIGDLHLRMAGLNQRIVNVSRAWFANHPPAPDEE